MSSKSSTFKNSIEETGRFGSLLNSSRKRRHFQIEEEDKEYANELKEANIKKDELIADLKAKIDKFEEERLDFLEDKNKLAILYDLRVIDSNGDPLPFNPNDEEEIS